MTTPNAPSSLACPRCGAALSMAQAAGAFMHGCSGCGGIWLDMQTSHRFCDALDGQAHALIESAERYAAYPVDTGAPVACPVCQSVLLRTRLQHAAVEIDYCNHHGSWFDKGELIRIAQAASVARAYGSARASNPNARVAPQPEPNSGIDAADVAEFGLEMLLAAAEGFTD